MTDQLDRKPIVQLVGMTIFAFAFGVSINILEPAVLGHKVLEFAPEWKNSALGAATFAGLIVAVLVQPIVGQISDRTQSRLGARAPFLIIGTFFVILAHFTIAAAPGLLIVVVGLLGLQFASNTVQGPWQALIPDHVPMAQRGLAAGLKATFDILGFIAGRQIGGMLIAEGNVTGAASVAAITFAAALLITILTLSSPTETSSEEADDLFPAWWEAFKFDWGSHPEYGLWFVNRLLFWGAITAVNTFILFFLIDVHGLAEPAAQRVVARLGVILGIGVLAFALPSGWVADRLGRRWLISAACMLSGAGILVLLLLHTPVGVTAGAGFLGIGTGVFLSGSWAMVTDLAPAAEAARYLGLANIASAGASAGARALGGALIDPINQITRGTTAGYLFVFGLAAIAMLAAAYIILRIEPKRLRRPI